MSGIGTMSGSPSFWSMPEPRSFALAFALFFARCSAEMRGTTSTVPPAISDSCSTPFSLRSAAVEIPKVVATSSKRSPWATTYAS